MQLILDKKIKKLPQEKQRQVIEYVDLLIAKYEKKAENKGKKKHRFKFDWKGGLSELKDKYTSIELQKKALEWR